MNKLKEFSTKIKDFKCNVQAIVETDDAKLITFMGEGGIETDLVSLIKEFKKYIDATPPSEFNDKPFENDCIKLCVKRIEKDKLKDALGNVSLGNTLVTLSLKSLVFETPEDDQECLVVDEYDTWLILTYDKDNKLFFSRYAENISIPEDEVMYWAELPSIK